MKIIIDSYVFFPSVGGIETVSEMLAEELYRRGHDVVLVTSTRSNGEDKYPFKVIRQPNIVTLLKEIRLCDIYFQNNISLKRLPFAFLLRKKVVFSHHTWLRRVTGKIGLQDKVKRFCIRFGENIAVSKALAGELNVPCTVVGNPYDDRIFKLRLDHSRCIDVVFLGRLVSDKGVHILIDAMRKLVDQGSKVKLVIIGDGPEKQNLQNLVVGKQISEYVEFLGPLFGEDLVSLLNSCTVLAVPSVWEEPFGIVALEGIACGCVVVGADSGGLKEAIGYCGTTFKKEDANDLAFKLQEIINCTEIQSKYRSRAVEHLSNFCKDRIVDKYESILKKAYDSQKGS